MKKSALIPLLTLALTASGTCADKALLAIPGNVIFESKLDTAPGEPWKTAKGKWEAVDGAVRGAEKPEDKHGAVSRLPNKLADFVLEYEIKLEGAKASSLSINAPKGHLARINITPKTITIQKDDSDHEGPDKAVVFARFATDLQPGTWHKVRMEMVGDTLLGKVDDLVAWGSHEAFKQERVSPGLTVGGEFAFFRNFKVSEATINPEWESVKATLPKPGEKMDPAPAPARKAEAK